MPNLPGTTRRQSEFFPACCHNPAACRRATGAGKRNRPDARHWTRTAPPSNLVTMPRQVNFAVIGTGNLAQNQHLPNLHRATHARLAAVCDLRGDVLKQVQEKYAVPKATTDHRQILADPEIDAVVIATREDQHVPLSIEALRGQARVLRKTRGRNGR